MSTAAPLRAIMETASKVPSSETSSVRQLVQRLSAEVHTADKRVHSLQTEAAKVFLDQEQRYVRFVDVADRIHAILLPRLQAFMNVNVFKDIEQNVSLEVRGRPERRFHARTTKLTAPYSDGRPTLMEFSFRVGHDGPVENAVMDYYLKLFPVLINFDSHAQLIISINDPNEETISAWIDDRLVGFTKTYFEVYFNDQYQKQTLELDPVLKIRFPRGMAVSTKEYQSRTYHFYTEESRQLFEKDPAEYTETV